MYLFSVAASGRWLNWSAAGAVALTALFQGSTWLTEMLTAQKYPKYRQYQASTSRLLPWWPASQPEPRTKGRAAQQEEEAGATSEGEDVEEEVVEEEEQETEEEEGEAAPTPVTPPRRRSSAARGSSRSRSRTEPKPKSQPTTRTPRATAPSTSTRSRRGRSSSAAAAAAPQVESDTGGATPRVRRSARVAAATPRRSGLRSE